MATSPDFVRSASGATRPLADVVFDALRESVVVVDTRCKHLPVVMANSAARRCLLGGSATVSLTDTSLYAFLGPAADSAVEAAIASMTGGKSIAHRVLTWRFPGGEMLVSTELKMLLGGSTQAAVMLTFAEPTGEPLADAGVLTALEQLPLSLMILNRELSVTYANAGAVRAAGGMVGEVLGHSALTLVPTAAVPREAFVGALEGRRFRDDAIAAAMPGSHTRWFQIDLQPLKSAAEIVGVAVVFMEVTDRRLRRRAAGGSDRRLLALTEHALDIIAIAGRDSQVLYVSGGLTNSFGYDTEECRSNSVFAQVHPDDIDGLRLKFGELVAGRLPAFSHQYRSRHKDGSYRWVEASYVSALDNPLIEGVVINSRDISERKQAETRLAQREEVFRLAADAVNGIIFEWDLDRGLVHRSRGVYDVLGLEPSDIEPVGSWSERIHPQDSAAYSAKMEAGLRGGRGWTATYRIRDARGRYRSMLERALIQRSDNGDALRAIGCVVDVSEIKRLTDLLAEIQQAAHMGGWEYSYVRGELEWTEEMFRIYETTAEKFVVSWDSMMGRYTPESRQRLNDAIGTAENTDGKLDLELEIVTLQERRVWVRVIGYLEKLDGRLFRAFGSMQNVQAQKLAQIALENSTAWLKLSMNMASMQAWRWNRSTDSLEFAIADGHMVHLPRLIPGMKKFMSRVLPADRPAVQQAIERAFEHGKEIQQEFRLKSRGGSYRVYASVARPLFDAGGQPAGLVGVTQDVTARHESEARLRRSEELLRTTTANTADTLLLVDTDLRVRFINREVCGKGMEEVVGSHISTLMPERSRARIIAKLRQVLATAQTATFEFDYRAPGAEIQYFENRAVLVREDGIGTGISVTVRNITERKRLEQEILDVSSRERQTIGRDLHDGLGQELTGIALMLRGLASRIQGQCPESVVQVNEITGLVNQSIETARDLARGLLPVNTDGGGLVLALSTLADRSRDLYGLRVHLRAEVSPAITLSETTASHLYRIAQEALTNTARHGHASAVDVLLYVTRSRFLLRITDDGAGIGAAAASATGMGLKIMKYRASIIGASFEIVPNHPRGTVVRVTGQQPVVINTIQSAHAI